MKICEKCQKEFPSKIVIDGKLRVLSSRKFCLECSPFGQHNTSRLPRATGLKNGTSGETREQECIRHGITTFACRYDGKFRCRKCSVDKVSQYRRNRKAKLVELAGKKCVVCGYDKCQQALHFHHVDPKTKAFHFSHNSTCRSLEQDLIELSKCVLLCANCHSEVEHGIVTLDRKLTGVAIIC